MKKTSTWLVIFLALITAGLYAIYWAARNRTYLNTHESTAHLKIHSWVWLLVMPIIVGTALIVGMVFTMLALFGGVSIDSGLLALNLSILVGSLIYLAIGLWWFWRFGAAIELVTQGRVRRLWTLFLFFLVGFFVIAFHQFYINRLEQNTKGERYESSLGLLIIIAVLTLMYVASMASSITSFVVTNETTRQEFQKVRNDFDHLNRLQREYDECSTKLEADFPGELTEENEKSYQQAYDKCQEVYKEYEAAYNRLTQI